MDNQTLASFFPDDDEGITGETYEGTRSYFRSSYTEEGNNNEFIKNIN